MITADERAFLCSLVQSHLEHFKREKIMIDVELSFLDSEAKYQKFLEQLQKKLQDGKI